MVRPVDTIDAEWAAELDRIEQEKEDAIARLGEGREIGCLFVGAHDERHPTDLAFRVHLDGADWADLTEAQIVAAVGLDPHGRLRASFLTSSQFDFWWED